MQKMQSIFHGKCNTGKALNAFHVFESFTNPCCYSQSALLITGAGQNAGRACLPALMGTQLPLFSHTRHTNGISREKLLFSDRKREMHDARYFLALHYATD